MPQAAVLTMELAEDEILWELFVQLALSHIKRTSDQLSISLNSLLLFAALFSAVNVGILALSIPTLSPGSADETDTLLRLVLEHIVNNSILTNSELGPSPFQPEKYAIRANRIFSASLTCSLLASFGGLVGMQWLTHYTTIDRGSPLEHRRDIQRKLDGARRWRLQGFVDIGMVTLIQLALILFIFGWVPYLHWQGNVVSYPDLGLAWLGAAFIVFTNMFAFCDPWCPFQTPITRTIRKFHRWVASVNQTKPNVASFRPSLRHATSQLSTLFHSITRLDDDDEIIDIKSLCWMLENGPDKTIIRRIAQAIPLIRRPDLLEIILKSENVIRFHKEFQDAVRKFQRLDETDDLSEHVADYGRAIGHLLLLDGEHDQWLWEDARMLLSITRSRKCTSLNLETSLELIHTGLAIKLALSSYVSWDAARTITFHPFSLSTSIETASMVACAMWMSTSGNKPSDENHQTLWDSYIGTRSILENLYLALQSYLNKDILHDQLPPQTIFIDVLVFARQNIPQIVSIESIQQTNPQFLPTLRTIAGRNPHRLDGMQKAAADLVDAISARLLK